MKYKPQTRPCLDLIYTLWQILNKFHLNLQGESHMLVFVWFLTFSLFTVHMNSHSYSDIYIVTTACLNCCACLFEGCTSVILRFSSSSSTCRCCSAANTRYMSAWHNKHLRGSLQQHPEMCTQMRGTHRQKGEINRSANDWHWWSWLTRVTLTVGSSCCPPSLPPSSLTQLMSKLGSAQRSQCGAGENTTFFFSFLEKPSSYFSLQFYTHENNYT